MLGVKRPVALLSLMALALAGCERGCLTTWLEEQGIGARAGGARAAADDAGPFVLGGTDCSDGLARCTNGRVEVSRAAHLPYPCGGATERSGACVCPWEAVGGCESGCASDGLEIVAPPDVAREQLCNAADLVLRPLLPSERSVVSICAEEGFSCREGIVQLCARTGQPAQRIAGCVEGCAHDVQVDHGDRVTPDGAATILCRRAHAERR